MNGITAPQGDWLVRSIVLAPFVGIGIAAVINEARARFDRWHTAPRQVWARVLFREAARKGWARADHTARNRLYGTVHTPHADPSPKPRPVLLTKHVAHTLMLPDSAQFPPGTLVTLVER